MTWGPGETPSWFYLLGFFLASAFLIIGLIDHSGMGFMWLFFGISMLGCLLVIAPIDLYAKWIRKKTYENVLRAQFEAEQRAKGLVKFVDRRGMEKWGTSDQVFEWQQLDKGLVKYQGKWITPKEKTRIEEEIEREMRTHLARARERDLFESEQRRKGLVKFTDRFGQEHWVSSEEIEILRKKDFEEQQKAKGLVKYQSGWVPPEEKFEKQQLAKGLIKFVDRLGHEKWGTPQEVEKWQQEDFEKEQREKGLVKYKGEWFTPKEAEFMRFKNEKSIEELAEEIAVYLTEKAIGLSLGTRRFREILQNFWEEKYPNVIRRAQNFWGEWDSTVLSKVEEGQREALKKFFSLLTEELIQWAQQKDLRRLTRADAKLFLMDKNITLSTSFEQMLYREAKLKYRYLPPWMRK